MDVSARYFDGERPRAIPARLARAEDGLLISPEEGEARFWPFAEARIDALKPEARLHRAIDRKDNGERLVLGAEDFQNMFGGELRRFGRGRADETSGRHLVAWIGGAIASLVFLFFVGLPFFAQAVVPFIPWNWEVSLGRSVEKDVLGFFASDKEPELCGGADDAGSRALAALVERLAVHPELKGAPRVDVLDSSEMNAFALPGGRVFLFRAIIEKAEGPDEVAGILGHEIGHVIHRHTMRAIVHDSALSLIVGFILGDVTGGTILASVGKSLAGSAYSRDAESEADRASVDLMARAGADPRAINAFFRRIAPLDGGPKLVNLFRSHPVTKERIAEVERLTETLPRMSKPILDASEWAALKSICQVKRKVKQQVERAP